MRSLLAAFVIGVALASPPARADGWVAVGPPGGNVRTLAADPTRAGRIYLGTADGMLYRSDDGGEHWLRLSPGFPRRGCSLDDIEVGAHGEVFVGFWEVDGKGGGVARSDDHGRTFAVLPDVEGESVRALALASSDPRVIAAGAIGGVFVSRNGGRAWKRITPPGHPTLRNVESVAFDPSDSRVLYVGTWHLGWKTPDGGATWVPMHDGMAEDSDIMTLTVDPRDPETVYATACTGIYRSTRGGTAWAPLQGIPEANRRTRAFALSEQDEHLMLAGTTTGLWMSEDDGYRWRRVTEKQLVVNAVLLEPDGTILLGTEQAGVLRSSDRGRNWVSSNDGFSERFVSRMLFDPAQSRWLVAERGDGRYGGVFESPGPRGPWTRLGNGLEGRQMLSLAPLGRTLYVGTDDGIFARAAEARSWSRVPIRLGKTEVHARITELIARPGDDLIAATSAGLFRSSDGGLSWAPPARDMGRDVVALAACPASDCMVAATAQAFFRSADAGRSWTAVSGALPGLNLHTMAFLPKDDRVLFATTTGGLFRSDDQAATWRRVEGGIPHTDLMGMAIHPNGRTLCVSDFDGGGVFLSADAGETWKRMPGQGLPSNRVWAVGFDPETPDGLLVGASAGGLHLLVSP